MPQSKQPGKPGQPDSRTQQPAGNKDHLDQRSTRPRLSRREPVKREAKAPARREPMKGEPAVKRAPEARKDTLASHFSSIFELPGDVVMNLPRVTMVGNVEMLIENHRGLSKYDPSSVRLAAGAYEMLIEGENLVIGNVDAEGVSIKGTITRITFEV